MEGAIGYDLHATGHHIIPPQHQQPLPTGITIKLPENTYGRISLQSGLAAKAAIDVAAGVIDLDYCGELKVLLVNNGDTPFKVKPGDQIAQLILENATLQDVQVTDTLDETTQGEASFGSTGMNQELAKIFEISLGHVANVKIPPQSERYQELWSQIPVEYHDYLDMFDMDLAMSKCPLTALGMTSNSIWGQCQTPSPRQTLSLKSSRKPDPERMDPWHA